MIKNILYSLFIHGILFFIIFATFFNKNIKKIEANDEVVVSMVSIDNSAMPPINEIIDKTPIKPNPPSLTPPPKPPIPEIDNPKPITNSPILNNDSKPAEDKKIPAEEKLNPASDKIKQPQKLPEKSPTKPQKDKNSESKNSEIVATNSANNDDKNIDNHDYLKVINLKAFKKVDENDNGSSLSIRETINIQSQIKMCYKRAIEESGFESKIKIIIKINISKDGYIENDLDEMIDLDKYNNPVFKDYKIIIDNIKRALELCSPLRNLPNEKYQSWKEIILQFDMRKSPQ